MARNKQITRSAPAKTLKFVNKTQTSDAANNDDNLNKTPTKNGSYKDKVFATQPRNSSDNSNTKLRRSSRRFGRPNVNPENNTTSDKDIQSNQINNDDGKTIENEEYNETENNDASVDSLSQQEDETESTQSQEAHIDNSNDRPRRSLRFSQSSVNPYDTGIEQIIARAAKSSKSKKANSKDNNKDANTTEGSESNETEADSTHQEETENGNASLEEDHLDGELDFGNEEEIEDSVTAVNENEEVDNPAQEANSTVVTSVAVINRKRRKYISKNVPRWAKATNGETVSWDSQESETSKANQPNKENANNIAATQADNDEEEYASEGPGSPIIGQINAFEHLLDFDPTIWSQDQVDYLRKLCFKTKFDRELVFKRLDSLRINPLEQFLKNDIKLKINELADDVLKVYLNQIDDNNNKATMKTNGVNKQKPTAEEQDVVSENEELSRSNSTAPRTPENEDQEPINEEEAAQINTNRSARVRSRSTISVQSESDTDYDSDTNTIVATVPSKKKQKPTAKKFWTEAENAALEQGILKHGCNWRLILDNNITKGDKSLINRTNINLKDRARSEKARRIKCGLELGVYESLILNVDSLLPKHLKEYN